MKRAILIALSTICTSISGCAKDVAVVPLCDAWESITVSKDDVLTEGTASQIKGNNVARDAVCTKQSPRG